MVPQDLPADGAGLAAGKARHDGVHPAGDEVQLAVVGLGGAVDAVRLVGLHDGDDGPLLIAVKFGEEAGQAAAQRAHARLQEDVGGPLGTDLLQLLHRFQRHGGVALHDPGGDVLIAFPGGVLHHDPAVLLGALVGKAHRVVVVQVGDGGVRPQRLDVVQPLQRRALGHVDHSLLLEAVGCPGHAAAVVAVGGGDKGDLAQLGPHLVAHQPFIGQLADVHAQPAGDVAADGVAAAQHLEGVQAEAVALVLDVDAAQAQFARKPAQIHQRGGGVFREAGVERLHLFGVLVAKAFHVRQARALVGAVDRLEALVHLQLPLFRVPRRILPVEKYAIYCILNIAPLCNFVNLFFEE